MLADVVVVPSTGPEAFGRVSVEAQAMGRPVVATDIGGLGETLMPAATGWLVPPGDADELARALELALAMPEDARARPRRPRAPPRQPRFTIERMAESTLAVYRELLGIGCRGRGRCAGTGSSHAAGRLRSRLGQLEVACAPSSAARCPGWTAWPSRRCRCRSPGRARCASGCAPPGSTSPTRLMIKGQYQDKPALPFVPGMEVAGQIERCGEGVAGFAPGDRVHGDA